MYFTGDIMKVYTKVAYGSTVIRCSNDVCFRNIEAINYCFVRLI